jgi:hypothetical protein
MQTDPPDSSETCVTDEGTHSTDLELVTKVTAFAKAQTAEGRANLLAFFHFAGISPADVQLGIGEGGKLTLLIQASERHIN